MIKEFLIISESELLKDVISKIEHSKYNIVFIADSENKYHSQIPITKLRRMILSGVDHKTPIKNVIKKDNLFIKQHNLQNKKSVENLKSLSKLANAKYVSIVDSAHNIVDILNVDNMVDPEKKLDTHDKNGVNNILIIGGGGYLGSILVKKVIDSGRKVRVLDNFIYGRKSLIEYDNDSRVEIIDGDLRNIEKVISCLRDIDAVILLAAIVGDPASKARPSQTIETNLIAAQALAFACRTHCIGRFIYASTCSVYGKGYSILNENSMLNPVSLYARTKIASEDAIRSISNSNFSPTILRMSTLYGYSRRMRFDLVVNTMTMKAFTENKIQVFGGKQWRPLLHVEDAADVYLKCIELPLDKVGDQTFNVGSEKQNFQIIKIANIISETLGDIPIEIIKADEDNRDYRVSFKKIQRLMNFYPKLTIEMASKKIFRALVNKEIKNSLARKYYNHFFDSTEEM